MPRELFFVSPMDCKSVDSLPTGEDWQYEIKFDGYRVIAVKQRGDVQLFCRRGNSFTADYPDIIIARALTDAEERGVTVPHVLALHGHQDASSA